MLMLSNVQWIPNRTVNNHEPCCSCAGRAPKGHSGRRSVESVPHSCAVDGLGRLIQRGALLNSHEALQAQVLPRLLDRLRPGLDAAISLLARRAGFLAHHLSRLALDEVRLLQARVGLLLRAREDCRAHALALGDLGHFFWPSWLS